MNMCRNLACIPFCNPGAEVSNFHHHTRLPTHSCCIKIRCLKISTLIPASSCIHDSHCGVAATVPTVLNAQFYQCSANGIFIIFSTKQMLWRKLADLLNEEFGDALTAKQTENKWKSLERGYKNSIKNNTSMGRRNLTCELETRVFG